ncbi:MAG: hypothetical protein ACYC63_04820 [Armatimonadota bacterium]
MYEAGRESAKKNPSPLLWVVCYFLDGESAAPEAPVVAVPPDRADFLKENGKCDGAAYLRAVKAYQALLPEVERTGLRVTGLHYNITGFVAQRKLEAQMLSGQGLLPGGIPFDKQPAWKWQLWSRYWSGESDERDRTKAY